MNRRQHLTTGLGLGFVLGLASFQATSKTDALVWRERILQGFGTTLWLRAAHKDAGVLEKALDTAVRAIRHVEAHMSLFDANSSLVQLNRDGFLNQPDPHLVRVLQLAKQISVHSSGAFDVTMQPLWQVWQDWRATQGKNALKPAPNMREALLNAASKVNSRTLSVSSQRVQFEQRGMAVSLNGIAQGYAADLVKTTLQQHGVQHALIDTGEWTAMGLSPTSGAWSLAVESNHIALPRIVADGRAIATSSDRHSAFSPDLRHHHIIHPATGYSPTHWSQVSVAAPSCAMADALTKVFFVQNQSDALKSAKRWGVDVLLVDKRGHWVASAGMPLA